MPLTFTHRLRAVQESRRSVLCVGLDPDPTRLPAHLTSSYPLAEAVLRFNRAIVEATEPSACAFKLNLAFYEALGAEGWRTIEGTLAAISPDTLVVADGKRGDIGNSSRFYAEAVFDRLGFDACTVVAYMGRDAVAPFLEYPDRAAFVLARTSNRGADDFQTLACGDDPLYLHVAERVAAWDRDLPGTAGLVAGATNPGALHALRARCPDLPFLIPGVGAQGGDAAAVMRAATPDGLVLVNSSRQILYAAPGTDFAEAAAHEAEKTRELLMSHAEA